MIIALAKKKMGDDTYWKPGVGWVSKGSEYYTPPPSGPNVIKITPPNTSGSFYETKTPTSQMEPIFKPKEPSTSETKASTDVSLKTEGGKATVSFGETGVGRQIGVEPREGTWYLVPQGTVTQKESPLQATVSYPVPAKAAGAGLGAVPTQQPAQPQGPSISEMRTKPSFISPFDRSLPLPETGKPLPEMMRVEYPKIFEVPKVPKRAEAQAEMRAEAQAEIKALPETIKEGISTIPKKISEGIALGKEQFGLAKDYVSTKWVAGKEYLAEKEGVTKEFAKKEFGLIKEMGTPEFLKKIPALHSAIVSSQQKTGEKIGELTSEAILVAPDFSKKVFGEAKAIGKIGVDIAETGAKKIVSVVGEYKPGMLSAKIVQGIDKNVKLENVAGQHKFSSEPPPLVNALKWTKEHQTEVLLTAGSFGLGAGYRMAALAYPAIETAGTAYFGYKIGESVIQQGIVKTAKGFTDPQTLAFALGAGTPRKGEILKTELKPVVGSVVMEEPITKGEFTFSKGRGEFAGGIKRGGVISTERIISGNMEVVAVSREKAGHAIVFGVGDVVETKKFLGIEVSRKVIQKDVPVKGVAKMVGMEKQFDFLITEHGVFPSIGIVDAKTGVFTFGYEPAPLATASAEIGTLSGTSGKGDYFVVKNPIGEITKTFSEYDYKRWERPFEKKDVRIEILPKGGIEKKTGVTQAAGLYLDGYVEGRDTPVAHKIFVETGYGKIRKKPSETAPYYFEKDYRADLPSLLKHELQHLKTPQKPEFEVQRISAEKSLWDYFNKFEVFEVPGKYGGVYVNPHGLKFDKQVFEEWKETRKEVTYQKTGVSGAVRLETGELIDTHSKVYSPIGEKIIELKTESAAGSMKQTLGLQSKTMKPLVIDVMPPIAAGIRTSVPTPKPPIIIAGVPKSKGGVASGLTPSFKINPKRKETVSPLDLQVPKQINRNLQSPMVTTRFTPDQKIIGIPHITQIETQRQEPKIKLGLSQGIVPVQQQQQKQKIKLDLKQVQSQIQEQIQRIKLDLKQGQPQKQIEREKLKLPTPFRFAPSFRNTPHLLPKAKTTGSNKKPTRPLSPKFDIITGFFEQQKIVWQPKRLAVPRGKRVSRMYAKAVKGYTPNFTFPTAQQLKNRALGLK